MGQGGFVEFVGQQRYLCRQRRQLLGRRHDERLAGDDGFSVRVDGIVIAKPVS
jgi:hypothetical protein